MTEPQVWAVIGVLAAAFAATITVTTQLMMRTFAAQVATIGAKVDGLRAEMVLRFERVDERFERVEQRLGRVEQRLDRVETRLDGLDRDVQAITRRVMPE